MLYRETLTAGLALDGQLTVFTLTLGTEVACTTEPLAVFTVQVTVRKKDKSISLQPEPHTLDVCEIFKYDMTGCHLWNRTKLIPYNSQIQEYMSSNSFTATARYMTRLLQGGDH